MRDWGQRQGEARYLQDVYRAGSETPFEREGVGSDTAIQQTRLLAKGKMDPKGKTPGFSQATLDLIDTYGLTDAEVLAVKMFTAGNFEYINPATANKESWMKGQMTPPHESEDSKESGAEQKAEELLETAPDAYWTTDDGLSHLKQLFQEGSLHGAVAIKALHKLPPKEGTCYRGARLTVAEFAEKFGVDGEKRPTDKLESLTSISTVPAVAERFANSHKRRDKTVCVITEVEVKTARDIGDLSLKGRDIGSEGEGEWLLFPGTFLRTVEVNVLQSRDLPRGNPPATKWVHVKAEQV